MTDPDSDAYAPFIVKLVGSKDNRRLVGATKSVMGQMNTEAYEKVTEVHVPVKSERPGRGQVQFEPKEPLTPGEYGVVLRAIQPGLRSTGSLGGPAEQTVFFSFFFAPLAEAARPAGVLAREPTAKNSDYLRCLYCLGLPCRPPPIARALPEREIDQLNLG